MTKRVFVAGYLTETNTFAPFPTGIATFKEMMWFERGEAAEEPSRADVCYEYISRARALGWDVVAGLRTFAQPGGRIPQPVYEKLRDEILNHLRESLPVDAVLLAVHGAMVADGECDGEGDLIARCRDIVGEAVPIGVHHDPHAHLTRKMVENADVIRIWKEYPHTDIAERCAEVFELIKRRLEGAPRARPVLYDCRMAQMLHTTREPMQGFVAKCKALEGKNGIQGVNIVHSFPWGDVPDMGTRVLVYAETEADVPAAEALAEALGKELWNMKEACAVPFLSIDESLDRAYGAVEGPVVIADSPDNPGGGAPGDSTYFLQRLLERGERDWAIGYLCDSQTVRIAIEAGKGASLQLRLGGKTCELSGEPVDLKVRVAAIAHDCEQAFGAQRMIAGDAVALELGDNRTIVAISIRTQAFDPGLFDELGVSLEDKKAIIVKSSQHFYALFAPRAAEVLYAAPPGVVTPQLASLPYEFADTSIWPLRDYAS
ncbi:MAG: M81 family metallopeptidase [Pseudomonadota bacterium]